MAKYTVENIPFYFKPWLWLYGWIVGLFFLLLNILFRTFCTIRYAGKENIANTPNHIFCIWHENLPLFFIAHSYFYQPNIWLSFHLWYMKPIHIIKKMVGIRELALGASGHDGKKALEKVLTRLKEGWSTFLTPDGPKGPLKHAKEGVLVMSLKTGVPIIPIAFSLSNDFRIPSWDRKRYPHFFSKMTVIYGKPMVVTKENFEQVKVKISEGMQDVEGKVDGEKDRPFL